MGSSRVVPVGMRSHRFVDLTWEEVRGLDRARAVAILPVGATEAHGPHLPLDTDVTIAEAMAHAGAVRLAKRGLVPLVLPPISYSPAPFAAAFPGTITVGAATMAATITDVATSLHRAGIGTLALANSHFDPAHLEALHAVTEALVRRGLLTVAFPDVTRKPWGSRLTEEFKSGACHAGQYEGSVVLAREPERVRVDIMAELAPNPSSLSQAIGDGARTFADAGGPRAYFGYPAAATPEEGEETTRALGAILDEAVIEARGEREPT
ncbi:MAG: creatininase family protein [Gemmatimonadetes bacterium]|nr:creatininase family protein [Gemmatimonadota bacterium]